MSLRRKNFPITFTRGVDTGTDPKIVIPSKFTRLENMEQDRLNSFRQRPGYTEATITAAGSPAVNVSNIKALHNLGSEMILEDAGGMHLFLRDRVVSLEGPLNSSSGTVRAHERAQVDYVDVGAGGPALDYLGVNGYSYLAFDAAASSTGVPGLECWVWSIMDKSGFVSLNYKVIDRYSNSVVQEGPLVSGTDCYHPRVLAVDDVGAGSVAFQVYYMISTGGGTTIRMRSIVSNGNVVSAPGTEQTLVTPAAASAFDITHNATLDRYFLAYRNAATTFLNLAVIGANGYTVAVTVAGTHAAPIQVAIAAVASGATVYGLAVYSIGTDVLYALSCTSAGAAVLETVLDTPTLIGAKCRFAVIPSPFTAAKAMVFYDTYPYTAGADAFPHDVKYLRCNMDGAAPTAVSTFARGVRLAARPAVYDPANNGVLDVCVPVALGSTLQPTVFAMKFGGSAASDSGFPALSSHATPKIMARLFPGGCGDTKTLLASTITPRLPNCLAASS